MFDIKDNELIHVLACVENGTVGEGDRQRKLYIYPSLIGEGANQRSHNFYGVENIKAGFYTCSPRVKFLKVVSDSGNISTKPVVVVTVGSFVHS